MRDCGSNLCLGLAPSSLNNMSFSTCSSFPINYQTLDYMQSPLAQPASSTARIYAGTRGLSSQISMSHSTSMWGSWGSRALATGIARGLADIWGHSERKGDYVMPEWLPSPLPWGWGAWRLDIGDCREKSRNTWRRRDPRWETGDIISSLSRTWGLRSLQVLWTMPTSFCRLTMPILLLMTSESSVRGSWPCASLWRVMSVGSERSLMTSVSLSCSWRQRSRLSRWSCSSWKKQTNKQTDKQTKNHEEEVNGLQTR